MIVIIGSVAPLMKKHTADNIIAARVALAAVRARKFAPEERFRFGESWLLSITASVRDAANAMIYVRQALFGSRISRVILRRGEIHNYAMR